MRRGSPMTRRSLSREDFPQFLTRKEVAEILGCSEDLVDRRIKAEELKAAKIGRLVRIAVADLNAYIKASKRWR